MNVVLKVGFDENDAVLASVAQYDAQHVERDADQIAVGDTIEDSIADNVIGDQRIPSVGVALDLDDELLRIRGKRQEPVPADEYATV
ncbi:hypothetical protein KTD19_27130 [Burkholderia multivorans]|uniref:Uncharacterized protein n=1 Tax=Burkholderia pseudomultivorans TaxID=1207504 RepID=A0A6P2J6V7_9BURK|nr:MULTISPECIES: hypothetical protein [Burkholderia cepacia complex]AIO71663.1 hypothetical protein DM80_5860 [Burkholderia multivorans]MBJ9616059.1 hypothetical protein [Burkholderia multivorans]MBU9121557.1 hypothetical protein [Burkholderia multivorans]MBU9146154.1 hypothetical protein [Burkholderia multivorans]MBU9203924.1 hypothetical protein [Burkholderia multivorans]